MRWSVLVVLAACGSRADRPRRDDAAVPVEHHVLSAPAIMLPKLDSFTLMERGRAPTSVLRYAIAGDAIALVETKLSSRHAEGGAWSAWIELAVRDGFAIKNGTLRPLVAEVIVPSPDAEAYLQRWKTVQDRPLTAAIDERGQLGAVVFADDPGNVRSTVERDDITQRLLGTLIPVPAEPVGVGAQWRVVTILRQRPAVVKQTATYTLIAHTDTRWTIAVDVQRIGEQQIVDEPELPKGTAVDLLALVRHYAGSVEIDPRRSFPVAGTLAFEAHMHLRIGHLPGPTYTEQLFEDKGTLQLTAR